MSMYWSHVGLAVSDLERSLEFYVNVLGFEYEKTIDVEGGEVASLMRLPTPCRVRVMMLAKEGFTLELMQVLAPEMKPFRERILSEPGLTHFNFRVADETRVKERVDQYGGTILHETVQPRLQGATDVIGDVTWVYIRDPDGQLLLLVTSV